MKMNNASCWMAIAAMLTGCGPSAVGRDGLDRTEDDRAGQSPVAVWASTMGEAGSTGHCWAPHDETLGLVIGFDQVVEPQEDRDPEIAVTVDGQVVPVATEVDAAGRFLAVLLDDVQVGAGYHRVEITGEVTTQLELLQPQAGDTNCDGTFNSSDMVEILSAGHYDNPDAAGTGTWATGDFNGDGSVDSSDLVAALSAGNYETGAPYATPSTPDGWVLSPEDLGALGPDQASPGDPLLENILKDFDPISVVVSEFDYDLEEDMYTVAFPVQENPGLEITLELTAEEEAQLVDGNEVTIEIDPFESTFRSWNQTSLTSEVLCEDMLEDEFRNVCGDVWFRATDETRNFKMRGWEAPVYMASRAAKKKGKKVRKKGKTPKKGKKGKSIIGLLILLAGELPKDTCGFQVALGKCEPKTCFYGAGWSERTLFDMTAGTCDAGPYGVVPGAINNCKCE